MAVAIITLQCLYCYAFLHHTQRRNGRKSWLAFGCFAPKFYMLLISFRQSRLCDSKIVAISNRMALADGVTRFPVVALPLYRLPGFSEPLFTLETVGTAPSSELQGN
ncbi:hypothetical protein V5799_014025 [Amblyomma americanum]|uniref:Uncharacterized protein n=1 Tax=Amblyomma americanum TaxID=6943 RepID=A0AAQ4E483_AMBAM